MYVLIFPPHAHHSNKHLPFSESLYVSLYQPQEFHYAPICIIAIWGLLIPPSPLDCKMLDSKLCVGFDFPILVKVETRPACIFLLLLFIYLTNICWA